MARAVASVPQPLNKVPIALTQPMINPATARVWAFCEEEEVESEEEAMAGGGGGRARAGGRRARAGGGRARAGGSRAQDNEKTNEDDNENAGNYSEYYESPFPCPEPHIEALIM